MRDFAVKVACVLVMMVQANGQNKPYDELTRKRAEALVQELSPGVLNQLANDDPLLFAIYAQRLRGDTRKPTPSKWCVDVDIESRPGAKSLVSRVLREMPELDNRGGVIDWMKRHPDVSWGREIMEEAVALYRTNRNQWNGAEVAKLSEIVGIFADESWRPFFDEIEASGMSVASGRNRFNARFGVDGSNPIPKHPIDMNIGSFQIEEGKPASKPAVVPARPRQPFNASGNTVRIVVVSLVIGAAAGVFVLLFKSR